LLLDDALRPATPLTNGAISGVAGLSALSSTRCVQVTATLYPLTRLNVVSKDGILEISLTGAVGKVGKFCYLATAS